MRLVLEKLDDLLNTTVIFGYDKVGYWVRRPLWDPAETRVSLTDKVCVVTGANAGLGKAASLRLAELGATIYMLCRNRQRGQDAQVDIITKTGNEAVFLKIVDLSSQHQIRQIADRFQKEVNRLDILINNAGVLLNARQESEDGIEMTFAINTLGYFLLTNLLQPLLSKSPQGRIINVSSGGMYTAKLHIDDLQYEQRSYNGVQAYAETKRAEVVLTQIWAQKLADTNIFVAAMHPGWAKTKSLQKSLPLFQAVMRPLLRSPTQGADTIVWLAANPQLGKAESGRFWFDRKVRSFHRLGRTRNTPQELHQFWQICCKLTGYQEP